VIVLQISTSNIREYFIFVNLANPATKHNLQFTRQILSVGYTSVLQYPDLAMQYLEGKLNYLPFVINEQRSTEEDYREAQRLYKWDLNSVRRFTLLEDSLTVILQKSEKNRNPLIISGIDPNVVVSMKI
jgi:hypothetical protein